MPPLPAPAPASPASLGSSGCGASASGFDERVRGADQAAAFLPGGPAADDDTVCAGVAPVPAGAAATDAEEPGSRPD
jgi:hypothetical protein